MSSQRSLIFTELEKQFKNPEVQSACLGASREKIREFYSAGRMFDTFPALLSTRLLQALTEELQAILPLSDRDEMLRLWLVKIIGIGCAEMLTKKGEIQADIAHLLEWPEPLPQDRIYALMIAFVGSVTQHVLEALAFTLPKKIETLDDESQCRKLEIFCLFVDKYKTRLVKEVLFDQNRVFDAEAIGRLDASKMENGLSRRLVELLKDKKTQKALFMIAAGFAMWGAVTLVGNWIGQAQEEKKEENKEENKVAGQDKPLTMMPK